MKVILLKHINNLGRKGEVKDVSDGYAINFLLPQKLVALANPKNLKLLQEQTVAVEKSKTASLIDTKKLLNKLSAIVLDFSEKADAKGTFFAGITAEKISEALQKRVFLIRAKQIKLYSPIKKAGEYRVIVNVDSSAHCEVAIKAVNR